MEPEPWPPSHCEALKEFVSNGMSYTEAANALNRRFGTAYSRSAALGRMRRTGLAAPKAPPFLSEVPPLPRYKRLTADDFRPVEFFRRPRTMFKLDDRVELRCVEVEPRHLALVELEAGDCRFPYGGEADGEPITFCGQPRRRGSSYCGPHFHLTRNPDVATERPISSAPLRLVRAEITQVEQGSIG